MMPELFTLGPISVSSFGVMMSLAFVIAGILMQYEFARKGDPPQLAWTIVLFSLLGGLAGTRLLFAFHNWDQFVQDPLAFMLSLQGMIWYGGLAGGVLATLWPIRRSGIAWASVVDTTAPALAIGQAIGRIGCHLAGDGDWGKPTDLPWAVAYTNGVADWPHPPGVGVHPAALYETIALLAVGAFLWRVRRVQPAGTLFCLYLFLAGVSRFLLEFVYTNEPIYLGLTEAQWFGAVIVVGAGVWLAKHRQTINLGLIRLNSPQFR